MNYNKKPHKARPYTKMRIATYALSFFMAVTPLLDCAVAQTNPGSNKPTTAQTSPTQSTNTTEKEIVYEGKKYTPQGLSTKGCVLVSEEKYEKAFKISEALVGLGFCDEGFDLLKLIVKCLDIDKKAIKDISLRYANECEKRELYEDAGWTYKRLGMKDKADECFKKAAEQCTKQIEKLRNNLIDETKAE